MCMKINVQRRPQNFYLATLLVLTLLTLLSVFYSSYFRSSSIFSSIHISRREPATYTLVIPSHTKRLESTLNILQYYANNHTACGSLSQIIVRWIDKIDPPAKILGFRGEIPVRIIKSRTFSLNERFQPDEIVTTTIFSLDDDLIIPCKTLEFGLSVHASFPDRIVGFVPRLQGRSDGRLKYSYAWANEEYSMILTGAAFISRTWLIEYWCDKALPSKVRRVVDEGFNSEDIGMNFVVAAANGLKHPILVVPQGEQWYMGLGTPGISSSGQKHMAARTSVMQTLTEFVGYDLLEMLRTKIKVVSHVPGKEWRVGS